MRQRKRMPDADHPGFLTAGPLEKASPFEKECPDDTFDKSYPTRRSHAFAALAVPDAGVLKLVAVAPTQKIIGRKVEWAPRHAVLTNACLAISREPTGHVLDYFPLHEVTTVKLVTDLASEERVSAKEGGRTDTKTQLMLSHMAGDALRKEEVQSWSDDDNAFLITTTQSGFNAGRSYIYRASDKNSCDSWVKTLEVAVREATHAHKLWLLEQAVGASAVRRLHYMMRTIYFNEWYKWFTGVMVLASFGMVIALARPRTHRGSVMVRGRARGHSLTDTPAEKKCDTKKCDTMRPRHMGFRYPPI